MLRCAYPQSPPIAIQEKMTFARNKRKLTENTDLDEGIFFLAI